MTYKYTQDLADGMLGGPGFKDLLDDSHLLLFSGPEPASAGAALDMVNDHTLIGVVTEEGGANGLLFGSPSAGAIAKDAAQEWSGTASFDGAQDSEPTLPATFFRVCKLADNGRGATSEPRLQGSVGVTDSGADMERSSVTIADGAPLRVGAFVVRLGSI